MSQGGHFWIEQLVLTIPLITTILTTVSSLYTLVTVVTIIMHSIINAVVVAVVLVVVVAVVVVVVVVAVIVMVMIVRARQGRRRGGGGSSHGMSTKGTYARAGARSKTNTKADFLREVHHLRGRPGGCDEGVVRVFVREALGGYDQGLCYRGVISVCCRCVLEKCDVITMRVCAGAS